MTEDQKKKLREAFEDWSGGFPPEGDDQITVYIDYNGVGVTDEGEARAWLRTQIGEWSD